MDVRHVLKHMFPRQFGFESPFTIQLDQQAGGPVFPDYTNRDDEIVVRLIMVFSRYALIS